jgi:hypothetical protein
MRALEMSTGKTSAELDKMMKDGKLTAEYIAPLITAIGELAEANGAYQKALMKLGTVENRMKASAGLAAQKIADAGFTEGLINLYNTLMDSMNNNEETLRRIGKAYEKVFTALSYIVKGATVAVEGLFRALETVWDLGKFLVTNNPFLAMSLGVAGIVSGIRTLIPLAKTLGGVLMMALRVPLLMVTAIITLLDELRAVFDENLIGAGENDKASAEDRKIAATQAKVLMTGGSEAQRKYLSQFSQDRIAQAQQNSGGVAGLLTSAPTLTQGAKNFASTAKVNLGNNIDPRFERQLAGMGISVNQNITVQGNMTEDAAGSLATQARRELEKLGIMSAAPTR